MTTRGRLVALAAVLGAALAAAGCGERAQTTQGQPQKKADAKPWEGASSISVAGSWKAGDQKAWEEQLRTRAQGQNEYTRTMP